MADTRIDGNRQAPSAQRTRPAASRPASSRPGQEGPRDRVDLSPKAREQGILDRVFGDGAGEVAAEFRQDYDRGADVVNRAAGQVGDAVSTAGEFGGVALISGLQAVLDVGSAAYRYGGRGIAAGLDLVGQGEAAAAVREEGEISALAVQEYRRDLGETAFQFGGGVGDSLGGAVEGTAMLVTHPVKTAEGLGQVIADPSLLAEGYQQTYAERGLAGAVGSLGTDVLTTVLNPGRTLAGGRVSAGISRGANYLSDVGQRLDGLPGAAANAGARGLLELNQLPARASALLGGGPDLPAGLSQRVDDFARGYNDLKGSFEGLDEATAAARLDEIVRDLEPLARELDELSGPGVSSRGAMEVTLPSGEALALDSRESVMRFLREDTSMGVEQKLRLARGVVADADPRSGVSVVEFDAGDTLGRVFSSDAFARENLGYSRDAVSRPAGSYFSPLEDLRKDSAALRADGALPGFNQADRGYAYTLEAPELAVASTAGSQQGRFGLYARGGGEQYQLLGDGYRNRLSGLELDSSGRFVSDLPGVEQVDIAKPSFLESAAVQVPLTQAVLQETAQFAPPEFDLSTSLDFGLW